MIRSPNYNGYSTTGEARHQGDSTRCDRLLAALWKLEELLPAPEMLRLATASG